MPLPFLEKAQNFGHEEFRPSVHRGVLLSRHDNGSTVWQYWLERLAPSLQEWRAVAAEQNMLADQFSSTGEFYRKLTGVQFSTLSSTTTTVASMTTESGRRITEFSIAAIVTGIAIALVILTVIRRRRSDSTKR